jgi:hypothetical protein
VATLWPTVHDRLVTLLPTLPGWYGVDVFDGPTVTGDAPTDYASVGYVQLEGSAGSYEFERHSDGWGTTELGAVRCEVVTAAGDTDIVGARARAFALIDALEASIRADQTLGVLPTASTCRLVVDVLPAQTTAGAVQRLAFTVEYTATTT